MRIISFAMTTEAYLAGRKDVTRRQWSDAHAAHWLKDLAAAQERGEPGLLSQGWSASPHRKGLRIGTQVVTSIKKERTCEIPQRDWQGEGFAYMAEHGLNVGKNLSCEQLWKLWRHDRELERWTIRFTDVQIVPPSKLCMLTEEGTPLHETAMRLLQRLINDPNGPPYLEGAPYVECAGSPALSHEDIDSSCEAYFDGGRQG